MKTNKELLIILRNQIKRAERIQSGLCKESVILWRTGIITENDHCKLYDYISNHRPLGGKLRDYSRSRAAAWYWSIGLLQPRLDWLNHHIKKLSK